VGVFANTIRELAAEIRGDVSTESLDLSAMPEVSVDVGGETDDYGIKADDTFWCKQGILRRGQLRGSEDEQLLADLAISILQEEPFAFSGKNLNEAYDPEQALFHSTNEQVVVYGADALKHDIQATISILRDTIEEVDPGSNALRRIVHPDGGSNPIKTAFYAVFMAFFELCVKEEKSPRDSAGIMASLENLQSRLHVSAGQIRSEPRRQNIDATKGMIQSLFEDRVPPATRSGPGVSIRFENALRRSKIETSAFECKQGLLRLDDSRSKDDGLLGRIVKTICGIANLGPDSSGAVFIGVADSDEDKNRVETLDNIRSLKIGSRYVVGIDRELNPLSIDLDSYMQQIVAHISDSALSEPLKSSVLGSIDCISYRGLSVICIWIPEQGEVSHVGDVVFARTGSETRKVEGLTQTQAIMERFS
jgi:hypothetical protein